ncbi:MAG: glycerol acyltransferase [Bacteroidales bacterium]|nr:glycerol acyltransferase [Bacteroidales bacterium]
MADTTENTEIGERYIDLDKVIKSKSERLYRWLPKFVVRWAGRLLHVDELNYYIYKYRDKYGPDFAQAILADLNITVEIVNPQNMPTSVNPMIVGNHPLGGVDGMALIAEVGRIRPDILFPVNDILLYLPGLRKSFVPINKFGKNSDNVKVLEEAFAGQNTLLYFPAGLCSRKRKGVIKDLEWKKTFVKKSVRYHRDVTPVFVDAHNSRRFYRWANIRKALHIGFNFEQLLLPSEMFRLRNGKIRLVFGPTIPCSTFDKSRKPEEWAARVRDYVYTLNDNPNNKFE